MFVITIDGIKLKVGMEVYVIFRVNGYADVLPVIIQSILDDCFVGYCEKDGKRYLRFYSDKKGWSFTRKDAILLANEWEDNFCVEEWLL